MHTQHQREVFRTFDVPETGSFFAQPQARESESEKVDEAFAGRSMNHMPAIYALPPSRRLENTPSLTPCMDIPFLQSKYKYDVCSLLGVPPDMMFTSQGKLEGSSQNMSKTQGSSRLFQAKMQRVCGFLKDLMADCYETIYKSEANFHIVPMPRLEIQTVEDLKILFECGILQPQHTIELSEVLMGSFKRKRQDMGQGGDMEEIGTDKGKDKGKETGKDKGKETGKDKGRETGKDMGKDKDEDNNKKPKA